MALNLVKLNADHLGSQKGFEPQRVNNAVLYIVGLGGDENVLSLSLNSFPLPKRSVGIIEVGYLNDKKKFAGNPVYDDLAIMYRDFVDTETARLLWKWNYQVHNPESGATGLAKVYKKSGFITMFAPDGSEQRQYNLEGMWPSGFDHGDADMMGEEAINITMTITVDKVLPDTGLKPAGFSPTIDPITGGNG